MAELEEVVQVLAILMEEEIPHPDLLRAKHNLVELAKPPLHVVLLTQTLYYPKHQHLFL